MKKINYLNLLINLSLFYSAYSAIQKLMILFGGNQGQSELVSTISNLEDETVLALEKLNDPTFDIQGVKEAFSNWIHHLHNFTVFEFIAYAIAMISALMMKKRIPEGWYIYIAAQIFLISIPFIFIGINMVAISIAVTTIFGAIFMASAIKLLWNKENRLKNH